jgi:outer membrane autotransporter protein
VDLIVDDRQTDYLVSELGLRVASLFDMNSLSLIPEVGIAWSHDFDVDDRDITASFTGAPGSSFTIAGRDIDHDGVTVDVGLTMLHESGWSAALKYNGDFRDDFEAHGVIGEVGYAF